MVLAQPFPNLFFRTINEKNGDVYKRQRYDDEGGFTDSGSATIFKRNTITNDWESQGTLINYMPQNLDYFGYDVSISEDYAIVGAYYDDEDGFTDSGSATIFKRNTITKMCIRDSL